MSFVTLAGKEMRLEPKLDLETKPLTRALISIAVRSIDPLSVQEVVGEPLTHQDLLEQGITRTAQDITDKALLLLGRGSIASSDELPGDAAVVIGFSLFLMLGIAQSVTKEGIALDVDRLTEGLIKRHLYHKLRVAGSDSSAEKEILDLSRLATQIPGQIVETAKGEVEDLFSRCYAVVPGFLLGDDKARAGLMTIFGTALHVLLQSQVGPDR